MPLFSNLLYLCKRISHYIRISAIPKDIVGKRNGVRYLIQ